MTRHRAAALALAAACAVPLVWPGDVSFINDEPLLVISAVRANTAGRLADLGLAGTYGFTYGPFPIWVYQLLLLCSRDLVVLVVLHAALMALVTASALWWLSRSLRLWPWFAIVPVLSPYFWFYARALWDNPFLIPLGTLAVAGYAANLASGSTAGLRVALAAMVAILLVHLMGLALVVPLTLHMLAVRGQALWKHRFSMIAILAGGLLLAWPYWMSLLAPHQAAPPSAIPSAGGMLLPLLGARLMSARLLEYLFGPGPVAGPGIAAAAAVTSLVYLLVWCGLAVAAWQVATAVRHRQWTARTHVAVILLGALVTQSAIGAISGKFEHPHYSNGTWIASTVLAWFAVDFVARQPPALMRWGAAAATGLVAAALLAVVATVAVRLHHSGGTREVYGPTIGDQQRVARVLALYSPASRVSAQVDLYERYPHTLAILRELNPPAGDGGQTRDLEVRYASDNPASGRIEVARR